MPSPKISPKHQTNLRPLWFGVFMDVLGFSLLIPILPSFITEFNVSPTIIGLLLSSNAVASFISGPIWGNLSDKYGRKPIMLICQLGTAIGFLILALSTQLWMLFFSRILDGVFGGIFTVAKAVVGDAVAPQDRGKQMTNIGLIHNIANIIGPVLGASLASFGIIGPGLLATFLCIIMLAQTAIFLVETAPVKKNVIPQSSSKQSFVSGSTSFSDSSRHALKQTVHKFSLLKNSNASYLLVLIGFSSLAFMTYISAVSVFATLKLGLSAQGLGLFLSIAGLFQIVVRFGIFAPMLRRFGERVTVRVGLFTFVLFFFLLGFVNHYFLFFFVLLGISFGAACSRGILTGFLSRSVGPQDQGKIMGISSSLDSMAQIFGPIIGGWILSTLNLFWFGAIPSFLSLVAFIMIFRKFSFERVLPPSLRSDVPPISVSPDLTPISLEKSLDSSSPSVIPLNNAPKRIIAMEDGCIELAEYQKACEEHQNKS